MQIELEIHWNIDDADEEKIDIAEEHIREETEAFGQAVRDRLERHGMKIEHFKVST